MARPSVASVEVEAGAPTSSTEPLGASPGNRPLLEHPEALHRFFASLADLESGRRSEDVRVLQFGDSHTASDYQTGPLRRALQKRFGDGGRGFVSVGRPWKFYTQEGVHLNGMTGWSAERGRFAHGKFAGDGEYGLLGVSITASQHGARAYTDLTALSSRIELDYLQSPHGGSVDVLVDGSRVERLRTSAGETKSAHLALDLSEGPHRIELDAVGDGPVRVFGLTLDRAAIGVTLDALGVNGARAGDLLRIREEHFQGELRHRSPALVMVAYGTNESTDDVPLLTYERQLVEVLGRIAQAAPTASCLLVGPPDRAEKHRVLVPGARGSEQGGVTPSTSMQTVWATVPRLLEIAAMERGVAAAAGCAYYSELDAMGGPGSIAGWAVESPPRAMLDRTHLSRQGYAELGDAIARDLVRAYSVYKSTTPVGGPAPVPLVPIRPFYPTESPSDVPGVAFGER